MDPTTTPTTAPGSNDPVYPWPVKQLEAGDVTASLTFATTSLVSNVPVDVTVTLVNQTDSGIAVIDGPETDVAIIIDTPGGAYPIYSCDPPFYATTGYDYHGILAPHATTSRTCQIVPADAGTATATVDLQHMMVPLSAPFAQTPVDLTVSAPPDTTTTTTG